MIADMKKIVARRRWRRSLIAARLCSMGERPKFENPVVAPGCKKKNFLDMKAMTSKVIGAQHNYFRKGTVMDNLLESGTEVVWFSDMTQNNVVYGICVQRQEKKEVTVVFRGTVCLFFNLLTCAMPWSFISC